MLPAAGPVEELDSNTGHIEVERTARELQSIAGMTNSTSDRTGKNHIGDARDNEPLHNLHVETSLHD